MVQVCKMVLSPGVLFNFKILIFRVVRGLKGQKITQNDKSFCLSHLIFQNHISYDLHLWYTCMYKRIKNGPKWQKFLSVLPRISGPVHHIIVIFGAKMT